MAVNLVGRPETTRRPRQRSAHLALDEPLGALDALTRIEMQRLVEQVWLANSFTAILVTHDVAEAGRRLPHHLLGSKALPELE
jgi:ABC-type nitrate/sulfonate/bicarbonate transport system ATPase subunit